VESPAAFVLGNVFVVLFAIAVVMAIVKSRRFVRERKPYNAAYILWGETLLYAIGIWFVYAGVLHAYFAQIAAPSIGWQPSPFEYELGWIEIPLGIVAIASLWRGYEFRLASTIVVATFGLAAAAQHIQQMTCCRNLSPSNAGPVLWFADIFLPLLLVVLAVMSRDEGPAQRRPYV
jgi:hypothetical protein